MKDRATLESNLFQHYAERLYTSPKSSDDKKASGVLAHLSALSKSAREQQGLGNDALRRAVGGRDTYTYTLRHATL